MVVVDRYFIREYDSLTRIKYKVDIEYAVLYNDTGSDSCDVTSGPCDIRLNYCG